jgi:signal transduction histidine kinase
MKLKTKVILLLAAAIVVTIAATEFIFRESTLRFLSGYDHLKLQKLSEELGERLESVDVRDPELLAREIGDFLRAHESIGIELFASDGTLLYSSAPRPAAPAFPEIMERLANPFQRMYFGRDLSVVYETRAGGEKVFALFDVRGDDLMPLQFFLYIRDWAVFPFFVVPLALLVVLPTLVVLFFVLWMTRRLNRLHQAMQRVDLSGDPVLLEDRSRDEIGELTKLYNGMIVKMHDQYRHIRHIEEARTKLISRLSHDLRTPLSIVQGYAETLQRGSAHERETRIRHATIILQKTGYMNELLRKLFRLAKLDDPSQAFRTSEGYMDSLLQDIMADYVLILQDRGMEWHLDIPEAPVAAHFDQEGLTQAIRNLIDNAILHGGGGNYLGVRLKRDNGSLIIEIEDRGKGIPPQELDHIFEPFYRVDKGRPSDGLGIGLTQADAIIKQHGGTIEVTSIPHVSTVFRVVLPKKHFCPSPYAVRQM